jgi:diguanylate cyclase (GGDEF)-like protein/PAS domain S-box-containing protein
MRFSIGRHTLHLAFVLMVATFAAVGVVAFRASEGALRVPLMLALLAAVLAYVGFYRELRERRRAEDALRDREAIFRAAMDGSLDAFYVLEAVRDAQARVIDFQFVEVNARCEALLGRPRAQLIGQQLCVLLPANRTEGFFDRYVRVLETGVVVEEELEIRGSGTGSPAAWIHQQVVPLGNRVAIISRDITERKRAEEALRAMSLIDELTGMYNRRGFLTLAQQQLKLARRGFRDLLLLFIDMDDFKEINDSYGHQEGDIALTRAAQVLRKTFRDSDIIARIGGDEFVVLAADSNWTTCETVIARLRAELCERNATDGYPYLLSFSIGAAHFDPAAPPTIEELLATADSMLYEQKKGKRHLSLASA